MARDTGPSVTASAAAAVVEAPTWDRALGEALGRVGDQLAASPDLVLLFASPAYAEFFPQLAAITAERTGARVLVGCSGQGVIGPAREIEERPALALLAVSLPGATLRTVRLTQGMIDGCTSAADWRRLTGVSPDGVNAWLIFADPFTFNAEALLAGLAGAYPGAVLLGGIASGHPRVRRTLLVADGDVATEGAVLVALGGPYTVRPVVSQGTEPIGQTWTVTEATGNLLRTIGGRPAHDVLAETFHALPPDQQARARANLLVGLAIDEYRDRFRRGDFLIRNLLGVDRESGALAIGAQPRVGQTVQFQLRDADAADEELRALLTATREDLAARLPVAALLCSCNGRGRGLFGTPDHDARVLAETFGPLPVAGFFCNGEIGPVGGVPFLHGFTASIGLIVASPES